MRKILLSIFLISCFTLTSQAEVAIDQVKLKADIAAAKLAKKEAEARIKALEAQLPPNEDVITSARFGYTSSTGNSKSKAFSLYANAKKAWGKHNASLQFDGQYGSSDGIQTTNKIFTEANYGYSFLKTLSITGIAGYKNDKFSSYNYQSYFGPGLKWIAYKSTKQELNLEGSVLYSHDSVIESDSTLKENYTSYRAKLIYSLQVLKNLKFDQEASYKASFNESANYFIYSRSALSSKISDMFSAGISYKIDYANLVSPDIKKQDTTLEAFLSVDY